MTINELEYLVKSKAQKLAEDADVLADRLRYDRDPIIEGDYLETMGKFEALTYVLALIKGTEAIL